MRRFLVWLIVLAIAGAAVFWFLTIPRGLSDAELTSLPAGNAGRGELVFNAGGCASCHAAKGATGDDRLHLGGGQELVTAFGTFTVPNISSDTADGIGSWSTGDLADAMLRGVDPAGRHLYPAFPYPSYARMDPADIADLRAYLATLPAVSGRAPDNALAFPFNVRRGIGLWKFAFLDPAPVVPVDAANPALVRGRYLVEGPGHCGECHTPRNLAGGSDSGLWLAGAVAAEGEGRVPNITPGGLDWSEGDIAYYLETGFTPDFDSVGGSMADVQRNMALLPASDRTAIAAYLKAIPAHK